MNHIRIPENVNVCSIIIAIIVTCLFITYRDGATHTVMLDSFNTVYRISSAASYSFQDLIKDAAGEQSGIFGRPVAILSFGLQKLAGAGSIENFKTTNILLHIMVFLVAFWFVCELIRDRCATKGLHLLPAVIIICGIWAAAPLMVSSVLYSVQRMTLISALFGLLALVFGRRFLITALKEGGRMSFVNGGLGASFFILALLSKENAVVIPALLAVVLLFDSQYENSMFRRLRQLGLVILMVTLLAGMLGLFFIWPSLGPGYETRQYGIAERLWYQIFAVMHYLKQIIYPDLTVMGVVHDDFKLVVDSLSFTTQLAVVVSFFSLIATTVITWVYFRLRLAALGLTFMWIALLLESSVIPLELYFEHRFYLPSIGLILVFINLFSIIDANLPVSIGVRLVYILVCVFFLNLFLTARVVTTWSDSDLLAVQAYNGHPNSERANALMIDFYVRHQNYDKAVKHSHHMSTLVPNETPFENYLREASLVCRAHSAGVASDLEYPRLDISTDLFRSYKQAKLSAQFLAANKSLLACDEYRETILRVVDHDYGCGKELTFKGRLVGIMAGIASPESLKGISDQVLLCSDPRVSS